MPIRAKKIADSTARCAPVATDYATLQVRNRTRVVAPANDAGSSPGQVVTKAKAGKKKPSGDYAVGYCRPPVATQFDGSRPGPGRPPGALSQDTLLKKHLTQIRPVAIEGRQTKMQNRELVLMMRMKEALSGNRHAADYVLAQAARLFSERVDGGVSSSLPTDMDTHDRAILDTLEAALLARALGEGHVIEDDDDAGEDGRQSDVDGPVGGDRS